MMCNIVNNNTNSNTLRIIMLMIIIWRHVYGCNWRPHENHLGEKPYCCSVHCMEGQQSLGCLKLTHPYAVCVVCPDNTHQPKRYWSYEMERCIPDTECYGCLKCAQKKDYINDRNWTCDLEAGCYSRNGIKHNPQDCEIKECPINTELTESGACIPCGQGFIKATYGIGRCERLSIPPTTIISSDDASIDGTTITTNLPLSSEPFYTTNATQQLDVSQPESKASKLWILGLIVCIVVFGLASVYGCSHARGRRSCAGRLINKKPAAPSNDDDETAAEQQQPLNQQNLELEASRPPSAGTGGGADANQRLLDHNEEDIGPQGHSADSVRQNTPAENVKPPSSSNTGVSNKIKPPRSSSTGVSNKIKPPSSSSTGVSNKVDSETRSTSGYCSKQDMTECVPHFGSISDISSHSGNTAVHRTKSGPARLQNLSQEVRYAAASAASMTGNTIIKDLKYQNQDASRP